MERSFANSTEKVALALMAADVQYRLDSNYLAALQEVVFRDENIAPGIDRKEQLTAQNKLATTEARNALTLIWRSSDSVTEEALSLAGYSRGKIHNNLNAHALAKEFCAIGGVSDLGALTRIQQDITRIIRAALAYRLIEYADDKSTKNKKPFKGTELLHVFLRKAYLGNAHIIQKLLAKPEVQLRTSGIRK